MKTVFHVSSLLCLGVWGYVYVWVMLSVHVCRREGERERGKEIHTYCVLTHVGLSTQKAS